MFSWLVLAKLSNALFKLKSSLTTDMQDQLLNLLSTVSMATKCTPWPSTRRSDDLYLILLCPYTCSSSPGPSLIGSGEGPGIHRLRMRQIIRKSHRKIFRILVQIRGKIYGVAKRSKYKVYI